MSIDVTMMLRILLATALGAVIGYQRERAGKAVGLRTHMLICLGSALFTVVSIYGFNNAPGIAAGVVTGVGFLGAGAILSNSEGIVQGLTTAASIWTTAAIGLAAGTGFYLVSVVAALLALLVLMIHPRIAR